MAQKALFDYGSKTVREYKSKRILTNLSHLNLSIEDLNDSIKFIKSLISAIKNKYNLDLSNYLVVAVRKENSKDSSMKWHIDDCCLFRHTKTHNLTELKNNIIIDSNFALYKYYKDKPLPIYSLVIYLSTYQKDFTGGEFCFVDQIIKPIIGDIVLFDSREVHKVNTVLSGNRTSILLKFYDD
jgi:hypothetical protein